MRIKSILLTVALATMCLFGQAQEQRDLKKEVKVRTNLSLKLKGKANWRDAYNS